MDLSIALQVHFLLKEETPNQRMSPESQLCIQSDSCKAVKTLVLVREQ
jgi:hypothetical protein